MIIAQNKKAFHDYFIENKIEAGMVLLGWEAKAIKAGRAQIKEAYIVVKKGELWLIGAHISPLSTTSTHIKADPVRTRKLLLHRTEINKLIGYVERKGFSLVPLGLHLKPNGFLKCEVGLAKGKKSYDKRESEKQKDWQRQKQRILNAQNR